MAEQVNAKFTSDASELSSTTLSGGSAAVTWNSGAGLGGQTGGLRITLTGATQAFGKIDFATWSANTQGRARVYIDPTTITMGNAEEFDCWWVEDASVGPVAAVRLGYLTASGYYLKLRSVRDSGADDTATIVNITDAEHWVEVHIHKESSDGADDGKYYWYIDSLSATVAEHLTVDNFNRFAGTDRISLGLITGRDAGTSGTFDMDEAVVRNDGTAIGSTNSAPVLTVPGAQTCTLGTQKSISGVSVADANGPSGLTVRIQSSGSATCTVDLTGTSVDIVNGTNGTNNFQIGTADSVADINTVLGTIKTDLAQVAWTDGANPPPAGHISATTTITLTAEDGVASDVETITCNWTMATGDGTKSLLLDNATIAGINSEIAASYYIPVTDAVGTDAIYIHVTDDNANTAEYVAELSISAVTTTINHRPVTMMSLGLHL